MSRLSVIWAEIKVFPVAGSRMRFPAEDDADQAACHFIQVNRDQKYRYIFLIVFKMSHFV
jgi:hypothetical protein